MPRIESIPLALRNHTDLPASQWQSKIEAFEILLQHWKGGYARTLLLIWAMLVVLCFMAAYMIPDFWGSTLFSKPWFLLGFCSTQIVLLTFLIWYSRRETYRLLQNTRQLFRPWRRQHGVNVTFYQVTNIVLSDDGNQRHTRTKRQYAGSYCFVLVCTLVREEDVEALELASLGTARDEEDVDAASTRSGPNPAAHLDPADPREVPVEQHEQVAMGLVRLPGLGPGGHRGDGVARSLQNALEQHPGSGVIFGQQGPHI